MFGLYVKQQQQRWLCPTLFLNREFDTAALPLSFISRRMKKIMEPIGTSLMRSSCWLSAEQRMPENSLTLFHVESEYVMVEFSGFLFLFCRLITYEAHHCIVHLIFSDIRDAAHYVSMDFY